MDSMKPDCRKRVLVVGDDAEFLQTAQEILADEGFDVGCACGVAEAKFLVLARPPHVILCDARDPGTSTSRLPSILRPHRKLSQLVVLACAGDAARRIGALREAGFHGVIEPPLDGARFLRVLGAVPVAAAPDSPATILVVDDDFDVRKALAETLEEFGFRCVTAEDGREALDVMRSARPMADLLVLDLMMPRLDGWQVLEHMQRDDALRVIPIVVVSAADAHLGPPSHIRLKKPIRTEDLLAAVQHGLVHRSAELSRAGV